MNRKIIGVAFLLLAFATTCFGATYYVSWNSGDDARSATQAQSKATPWKHAPGMDGEGGTVASFTPSAGDTIVFKGGETWSLDVEADGNRYGWTLRGSGNASAGRITYTVDATWYSGASWSRPVLKPDKKPWIFYYSSQNAPVSAITKAAHAAVTTSSPHGLATGNIVMFKDVAGMTEINRIRSAVTVVDSTHFTCDDIDSSAYSTYTSGGTVGRVTSGYFLEAGGNDYWTINGLEFREIGTELQANGCYTIHVSGPSDNYTISNCRFQPYDTHCIVQGVGALSNIHITGNTFSDATNYIEYTMSYGVTNLEIDNNEFGGIYAMNREGRHADGIQFWDTSDTGNLVNFRFHHNHMTGNWGTPDSNGSTHGFNSFVYINAHNQTLTGPIYIYNNLIEPTFENTAYSGFQVNAIFYLVENMPVYVYNNTFRRTGTEDYYKSVFRLRTLPQTGSTYNIKNNIYDKLSPYYIYWFENASTYDPNASYPDNNIEIDYNVYYNEVACAYLVGQGGTTAWADWIAYRSNRYDQHSRHADPDLDGNGIPKKGSEAIDNGISFSTIFTDDYAGTGRPQGNAWDIGAYEYRQGGASGAPLLGGGAPILSGGVPVVQ